MEYKGKHRFTATNTPTQLPTVGKTFEHHTMFMLCAQNITFKHDAYVACSAAVLGLLLLPEEEEDVMCLFGALATKHMVHG